MGFKYDVELMVNVAKMYYIEGLKQDEIAHQVKVSRSSISLILKEARKNEIVEISVRNPMGGNHELAAQFEKKFDLQNCYIVSTSVQDQEILLQLVIRKAVEVFNSIVKSGDLIGMAWGQTCYQFMHDYSSVALLEKLRVVPLIGGSLQNMTRYQMNEVVRLFAGKLNGDPVFIHAPAFPQIKEDYDLYMNSTAMKNILELWEKVEIAIISIGAPPVKSLDSVAEHLSLNFEEKVELSLKAVGDICARFFTINGQFIENPMYQRTIGITPDVLKGVKTCLAIVSGQHKLSSIVGGLCTGVVDILIIDEPTAVGVLNLIR